MLYAILICTFIILFFYFCILKAAKYKFENKNYDKSNTCTFENYHRERIKFILNKHKDKIVLNLESFLEDTFLDHNRSWDFQSEKTLRQLIEKIAGLFDDDKHDYKKYIDSIHINYKDGKIIVNIFYLEQNDVTNIFANFMYYYKRYDEYVEIYEYVKNNDCDME